MEKHSVDSTEFNKPLKHELGLILRASLLLVSSWHCGIITVYQVGGDGFETHFLQKYLTNCVDSTEFTCWKNLIMNFAELKTTQMIEVHCRFLQCNVKRIIKLKHCNFSQVLYDNE